MAQPKRRWFFKSVGVLTPLFLRPQKLMYYFDADARNIFEPFQDSFCRFYRNRKPPLSHSCWQRQVLKDHPNLELSPVSKICDSLTGSEMARKFKIMRWQLVWKWRETLKVPADNLFENGANIQILGTCSRSVADCQLSGLWIPCTHGQKVYLSLVDSLSKNQGHLLLLQQHCRQMV